MLVASACGLGACSKPACEKAVTYALPAPDGAVIAFVYRRTCGAARDVSTHVSLVPYGASLHDEPGNVLVVTGEQPVKVAWHSGKELFVSGFQRPSFQCSQPIGAVSIEFAGPAALEAR